jgi:hypothetical protein
LDIDTSRSRCACHKPNMCMCSRRRLSTARRERLILEESAGVIPKTTLIGNGEWSQGCSVSVLMLISRYSCTKKFTDIL